MKWASTVWLMLFLLVIAVQTSNAQELKPPQRVSTSTGIYDVESPDDIHKFSATEIRELVRMENERRQSANTSPHPILVYCFEERTFQYTGGKYKDAPITYRLHTPKTIRYGRKYPLIVHLHGHGDDSLTHLHPALPLLIGPAQQDFFMLITQAPRTGTDAGWRFLSTKDGSLDVLMAAMEHVITENPIDTERITVTGISSGGWATWALLQRYPDLFAGAVPTACGAPRQLPQLAALKQTPIWSIANKGDRRVNTDSILTTMHAINNAGGSMAFTETDALGHNAFGPAVENYKCLRWTLAQKRGNWFSPPPGAIIHKPNSLPLVFILFILPLSIIAFLLWGTICEWVETVWQSIMERIGS